MWPDFRLILRNNCWIYGSDHIVNKDLPLLNKARTGNYFDIKLDVGKDIQMLNVTQHFNTLVCHNIAYCSKFRDHNMFIKYYKEHYVGNVHT